VTKRTGCRCQQRGRGRACTPTLRFEWNVHSQFRSFGRLQQYRCRSECISRNQFATFCIACLKYLQVGTIFGIHRRLSPASSVANLTDALQPARALVASGYCMYGASSILMLAVSGAVNGFTLDMSIGEFVMTHRDVKVPQRGAYYSANEGRSESWDDATKAYSSPFMLVHRYCVSAYPTKSQVRERRKEWHFLWQSARCYTEAYSSIRKTKKMARASFDIFTSAVLWLTPWRWREGLLLPAQKMCWACSPPPSMDELPFGSEANLTSKMQSACIESTPESHRFPLLIFAFVCYHLCASCCYIYFSLAHL